MPMDPASSAGQLMQAGQGADDLLRTLFEVVQLSITVPVDQVIQVAGAAERIGDQVNPQGTPEGRAREAAVCAPGAVRSATSRAQSGRELQVCGSVVIERHRRGGAS